LYDSKKVGPESYTKTSTINKRICDVLDEVYELAHDEDNITTNDELLHIINLMKEHLVYDRITRPHHI